MSVRDPERIDERSMFECLKSDSGYQVFGEVRLELRGEGNMTTIVQPLLLPDAAVIDFRRRGRDSSMADDSIAAEIRDRVRTQSRAIADSIAAATLDERARQMKQRAESLRARSGRPPQIP